MRWGRRISASPRFSLRSVDLVDSDAAGRAVEDLLSGVPRVDLAVLNAGLLSPFGDMRETSLEDLRHVMEVNLWSQKTVLDVLLSDSRDVRQVVTMSSGASVNGNRGWNGYSISKAALNMLTRLYARECPDTHFAALAPR